MLTTIKLIPYTAHKPYTAYHNYKDVGDYTLGTEKHNYTTNYILKKKHYLTGQNTVLRLVSAMVSCHCVGPGY